MTLSFHCPKCYFYYCQNLISDAHEFDEYYSWNVIPLFSESLNITCITFMSMVFEHSSVGIQDLRASHFPGGMPCIIYSSLLVKGEYMVTLKTVRNF